MGCKFFRNVWKNNGLARLIPSLRNQETCLAGYQSWLCLHALYQSNAWRISWRRENALRQNQAHDDSHLVTLKLIHQSCGAFKICTRQQSEIAEVLHKLA